MRLSRRSLAVLIAITLLTVVSACTGGSASKGSGGSPGAPSEHAGPQAIPVSGPQPGACFDYTFGNGDTADKTVPCTVKHTGEIARVLSTPEDLDPAIPADKKRLDQIGTAQCPQPKEYVGYRGILTSAVGSAYTAPTTQARAKGAHWLACTVVTYVPASTPSGDFAYRERTGSLEGALTTDAAWLKEGMFCRPDESAGQPVACTGRKGQWLALASRPDPEPFVSGKHQGEYAQSFCQAAADAYGKSRPPWHAFWSATAKEDSGQNCLIAVDTLNKTAPPVVLAETQTKFDSTTASRYAAALTKAGQRLATEPALMSKATQVRDLRASPNYFPPSVQDRTVCKALSCQEGFGVTTSTAGNTTKFTFTTKFEGRSCKGTINFSLGYLGAPFTVEKVTCQ